MEGVEQEDWQAERCPASCGNPLLSAEATYRTLSKLCRCQAPAQLPHNSLHAHSPLPHKRNLSRIPATL